MIIDSKKSHLGGGRTPIGHEQPFDPCIAERGDKAVPGGEVGHCAPVQRERRAQQGGNAAVGEAIVAELDGVQFERSPARRGALRYLIGAAALGVKSHELRRDRRSGFACRHSGERRPKERRIRKLTSETPNHLL